MSTEIPDKCSGCGLADLQRKAIDHFSQAEDNIIMQMMSSELDEHLDGQEFVMLFDGTQMQQLSPEEAKSKAREAGSSKVEMIKKEREEHEKALAERLEECPGRLKMRAMGANSVQHVVYLCQSASANHDGSKNIEPVFVERHVTSD